MQPSVPLSTQENDVEILITITGLLSAIIIMNCWMIRELS